MEARFLITTAEKRSWKNDQPVLFLGEWCKLYSNKSEWKKLDAVTLSYHWDDRRKLYKDYQYLQNVYENFLKQLADELNQFHGTNNSVRYWRVVIGPWLNLFVQMLFDRWELVRDACSNYKISGTSVLRFNDNEMTPQGMEDFHFYYQEDEWNHYIFSKIIEKQHRSCIEELDVYDDVVYEQIDKRPVQPGAREALKNGLASVLDYLSKNADVFIISSYFDRAEQWKLEAMLGQIPTFRKSPELPKFEIGVRDGFTLSDNQKTDFEGFLASILPIQLPVIYLEGYKNIRERALTCNWPSNPKVIYTAVSHSSDEFCITSCQSKSFSFNCIF